MPSFVISSIVVALYEPVRIPADFAGQKGFNVYHSAIPLQFSEIPVCIAHRTLRNRCPPGTIARVRGTATVEGRSLLICATTLIPAAIESVPGPLPPRHFCLPRVIFDGFVSSKIRTLATNAQCFVFDVTIVRRDVWPGTALVISCWVHRDRYRFHLLEEILENTPVVITGVASGWTYDDKLMVDVHTLGFNNNGSPPTMVATDSSNPFVHAEFRDGFAVFPIPRYDRSRIRSVLSPEALPTQVAMYTGASRYTQPAQVSPPCDQDPSTAKVTSLPHENDADSEDDSPPSLVDLAAGDVRMDSGAAGTLPSIAQVRAAAVKRARARAVRTRKAQRVSSPEVPLQPQVKLKISRQQLATIRG